MTSKRANRYPPELRERAVRMLPEQRSEYRSEYAAINSIAPKIGCSPDTLRAGLRQHERNNGSGDAGLTQSYRASGLTLLTAAISLRNTVYMERASDTLKRKGMKINEQLLVAFSDLFLKKQSNVFR